MLTYLLSGRAGIAAAALFAAAIPLTASAAVSFADISLWAGVPAGPGVAEAALVLDWADGSNPIVWGYRWDSTERKTGLDMVASIIGVDSRLSVSGLDSGFLDGFAWDPDRDGAADRIRFFYDNATPDNYLDDSYWNYSVNNDVYNHPTDFLLNSHIVPPATVVVPLGNPYAETNPASWTQSNTGPGGRELADGSWDSWAWGVYGTEATQPVPAMPVPEPGLPALLVLTSLAAGLRRRRAVAAVLTAAAGSAGATGPYAPGPGVTGTSAIPAASVLFQSWAAGAADFSPGPQKKGSSGSTVSYGTSASALGPSDALGDQPEITGLTRKVVSLGDGGSITLTFSPAITNGGGADFAVFENGFGSSTGTFAELAFVEVSSNGADFVRFPAASLTQTSTQISSFGVLDPRDLNNLAGKYPVGYGTPFDLEELKSASPLLDVSRVTHVRIIDVVGSLTPGLAAADAEGRTINDPWPTQFSTGGFDLDAVGVLHEAPAPWAAWQAAHFTTAQRADALVSGPAADPDNDGLANVVEYATGSDPVAAGGSAALDVERGTHGVTLTFPRVPDLTDVELRLEHSGDARVWATVIRSAAGASPALTEGRAPAFTLTETGITLRTVQLTAPDDGRGFFRLAVTRL